MLQEANELHPRVLVQGPSLRDVPRHDRHRLLLDRDRHGLGALQRQAQQVEDIGKPSLGQVQRLALRKRGAILDKMIQRTRGPGKVCTCAPRGSIILESLPKIKRHAQCPTGISWAFTISIG
jgi:hypothetical protein